MTFRYFFTALQVVQTTQLKSWTAQHETLPWAIDAYLSFGHYATTRLLRLGVEEIDASPLDKKRPAFADRLLKNGQSDLGSEDAERLFVSALTGDSPLVIRIATQLGVDPPVSESEEDLTVVTIFKALLHHGGLAAMTVLAAAGKEDEPVPASVVRAFELAHENAELERDVSSELGLSRTSSVKAMNLQRTRAEFLLGFNSAIGMARTASDTDAANDTENVLKRGGSARLQRRASSGKSVGSAATVDDSFNDVKKFVMADIDLEAICGQISKVEGAARLRSRGLSFLLQFLAKAETADSVAGLLIRQRVANSLLRSHHSNSKESESDHVPPHTLQHFLSAFKGCGRKIASEIRTKYFAIVKFCLGTPEAPISTWAALLTCVWRPEDCSFLQELDVWTLIDSSRKRYEDLERSVSVKQLKHVREQQQLLNVLQFGTALSAATIAEDEGAAEFVLSVVTSLFRALAQNPTLDFLPKIAVLLPASGCPSPSHVLADKAVHVDMLRACLQFLDHCAHGTAGAAGSALLILRRMLSFTDPESGDAALVGIEPCVKQSHHGTADASILQYLAQIASVGVRPEMTDWTNQSMEQSKVEPIGIESGTIGNSAFTCSDASEVQRAGSSHAAGARLNGSECWTGERGQDESTEDDSWIQINLGADILITGVATQGFSTPEGDAWTTQYSLSYSLDGIDFYAYEEDGAQKIFDGNRDATNAVSHKLLEPVAAHVLRLYPQDYCRAPALRLELYGVRHWSMHQNVNCKMLAIGMLIELPKFGKSEWKLPINCYIEATLAAASVDGLRPTTTTEPNVALQLCGGFAETLRNGALVKAPNGTIQRLLQLDVSEDHAIVLNPGLGVVSESTATGLVPYCAFDLDISVLDPLLSVCGTYISPEMAKSGQKGTSLGDQKRAMLAVRAVSEFAGLMKEDAASMIARKNLFHPLLALSAASQPDAGLDREIETQEGRLCVLSPRIEHVTDAIDRVLTGTSSDIRKDISLVTRFTISSRKSRHDACLLVAQAGGAKAAVQCLKDSLNKLRAGSTTLDRLEEPLPGAVLKKTKSIERPRKVWHAAELAWGTCGNKCHVCIEDKGVACVGNMDDYGAIAKEHQGTVPDCQYPAAGNAYSGGSNEPALYDAAKKVALETLYPNFPDACADNILVLHGNLPDGWAHSHEGGSMEAWKSPREDYGSEDTYAWCRNGRAAEKRYHVYVCADCDEKTLTKSGAKGKESHHSLESNESTGQGLLMAGVSVLHNIALYTSTEMASQVAAVGGIEVLTDLLTFFRDQKVVPDQRFQDSADAADEPVAEDASQSEPSAEPSAESAEAVESPNLVQLVGMGFGRAASIQALKEAQDNVDVAASLLADIGDAILSQPKPADVFKAPSKFAALLIKPNVICLIADALRAFSLRLRDERSTVGAICRPVLRDLLQALVQESDAMLMPLPQLGEPLGLQSGDIGDKQLSASSALDKSIHDARFGRLRSKLGAGAWMAQNCDKDQWLLVDLGSLHWITAVATQGRAIDSKSKPGIPQWVTKYSLSVSLEKPENTESWHDVDDFEGNSDSDSVVTHRLEFPREARYVRFKPKAWHGHISMRAEVFGHMPENLQSRLTRTKFSAAASLLNVSSPEEIAADQNLIISSGIVDRFSKVLADAVVVQEDDPHEEEPPVPVILPAWEPEFQEMYNNTDQGKFEVDGNVVNLSSSSNYCLSVLNIPFPKTGRHTAVIRMHNVPENCGIGVVKSFEQVKTHSRGSKAWIGNGPNGWCLFKDGDSAHDGSWKGGSYSNYTIGDRTDVGVTFDADKKSVSFSTTRGGKRHDRPDCFTGISSAEVFLAVTIYKRGKFELLSTDWEHFADGAVAASSAMTADTEIHSKWTLKPGTTDNVMWFWAYIPGSAGGNVQFKYKDGENGTLQSWSGSCVDMDNGWWHTAGWNRGYERYLHSCWYNDQIVVDGQNSPLDCTDKVPEDSNVNGKQCLSIPVAPRRHHEVSDARGLPEVETADTFAAGTLVSLQAIASNALFAAQIVECDSESSLLASLVRLCQDVDYASLPGMSNAELAHSTLALLAIDAHAKATIDDVMVEFGGNSFREPESEATKEKVSAQLQALQAMGFDDMDLNGKALAQANYDMARATTLLVEGQVRLLPTTPSSGTKVHIDDDDDFEPEPENPDTTDAATQRMPRTHICELNPAQTQVGYGDFSSGAELGYESGKLTVGGVLCHHGLSMHPPSNGSAFAEYVLPPAYKNGTLTAQAAMNDDVSSSVNPVTFSVSVDGKEVWCSEAITKKGAVADCQVVLADAGILRFSASCAGNNGSSHAVWSSAVIVGSTPQHWSLVPFNVKLDNDVDRGETLSLQCVFHCLRGEDTAFPMCSHCLRVVKTDAFVVVLR